LTHSLPSPFPDGTYDFLAIDTSPASISSQTYTVFRIAIKNDAVFEIGYSEALGGEYDVSIGVGEGGVGAKEELVGCG
jgi:hypothetical protein